MLHCGDRVRAYRLGLCLSAALPLAGCSVATGFGGDGSKVAVENSCEVTLTQVAVVDGADEAAATESVRVSPDCTVEIDYKSEVGNE